MTEFVIKKRKGQKKGKREKIHELTVRMMYQRMLYSLSNKMCLITQVIESLTAKYRRN